MAVILLMIIDPRHPHQLSVKSKPGLAGLFIQEPGYFKLVSFLEKSNAFRQLAGKISKHRYTFLVVRIEWKLIL